MPGRKGGGRGGRKRSEGVRAVCPKSRRDQALGGGALGAWVGGPTSAAVQQGNACLEGEEIFRCDDWSRFNRWKIIA